MKLKVYTCNKKVIDCMEKYNDLVFCCKLGPSTRQKNLVIIFSHTKFITYKYFLVINTNLINTFKGFNITTCKY
jgi:hypothetical protein